MHAFIASLILSALSTAASADDIRRIVEVCDRMEHRCPDDGSDYGGVVIDAINATDLAWQAYVARLEGNITYAIRCERALDRILSNHGF